MRDEIGRDLDGWLLDELHQYEPKESTRGAVVSYTSGETVIERPPDPFIDKLISQQRNRDVAAESLRRGVTGRG